MGRQRTVTMGEYCDFLDDYHEIRVHGQEAQPIGQAAISFKPTGFECQYASKCKRNQNCPIWKRAIGAAK